MQFHIRSVLQNRLCPSVLYSFMGIDVASSSTDTYTRESRESSLSELVWNVTDVASTPYSCFFLHPSKKFCETVKKLEAYCTDSLLSFAMAGFKQPCNSPCWRGILWDKLAQMKRLYSVIREEQVIFTYYMHTQHRMYYLTNTSRWKRMNVPNSCDHVIVYIDIETWPVMFFPRFLGSEEAIFSDYP